MRTLLPVVLLLVLTATAAAMEPDGSILLPVQTLAPRSQRPHLQAALAGSESWRSFTREHGRWTALWNEVTGTPQRAIGPAITPARQGMLTAASAGAAGLAAVREHAAALGVDPGRLRMTRNVRAGDVWYVSFVQTHGGVDVLLSEVELRFSPAGNLLAFGSVFYPGLSVATVPVLEADAAAERATDGLTGATGRATGRLFVLPVSDGDGFRAHLVREVAVERADPPGVWLAFVDAHTGTVLWRHNRVRSTDVTGRVRADVQLLLPTDPYDRVPLSSQDVLLGGLTVTSDSAGAFRGDPGAPVTLTARLTGPAVDVQRVDGPDAEITLAVAPGDSVEVLWTDANSHPAERDAFYHTNVIHDYITTLDPAFTTISYRMPCVVNINQTCNAFWNGVGINFFVAGNGCPNTAQMPDVVFHEYGHGINDKLYEQLGSPFGMINGATHEGLADVASAVITDDPRIGLGFFGPGTILRSIENTFRYPENASTSPHSTGLILAGALWDVRRSVSADVFRRLSHFAKYGLPDDPNTGLAFGEWFVEVLVADDDDGNLANGTPHAQAILTAFDAHGIGSALIFGRSFSHTPIPSSADTTVSFTAEWSLSGIPGIAPDSVRLVYSTDDFQTVTVVPGTSAGGTDYSAVIPPQSSGSVVEYYISAFDGVGRQSYRFPATAPATAYRFLVGSIPTAAGRIYAATGAAPVLHTLNPSSGASSPVGSLGTTVVHTFSIHPRSRELYALTGGGDGSVLARVSPDRGDAFTAAVIPVPNLRAFAFGGGDTLFAGDGSGRIFRVLLSTMDTAFVGSTSGVVYASLAFHPHTGELWASVRPPVGMKDAIYRVNRGTGQASLVGRTGDGRQTWGLTFTPGGELIGLKGQGVQENTIILIDQDSARGTLIGATGLTGLVAIAMRSDSAAVTDVPGEPAGLPEAFTLSANYPNPFNPATRLELRLARPATVRVTVHDALGRDVAVLAQGEMGAGVHPLVFDAARFASGVYFARMSALPLDGGPSARSIIRMLLLR